MASNSSAPTGRNCPTRWKMEIEQLMDGGLEAGLATGGAIGRAKRIDDSQARYIEFAKRTFPRNLRLDGLAHRDRLRPWRRLQGGAGSVVGVGRRHRAAGGVARRHQHQSGMRLDRARSDVRQGARNARRFRHRAGRRCRPGGDGRRAWPHHRRRPDPGPDRQKLVDQRHAQGRRRGRHGDVQCRAGPLSQEA